MQSVHLVQYPFVWSRVFIPYMTFLFPLVGGARTPMGLSASTVSTSVGDVFESMLETLAF